MQVWQQQWDAGGDAGAGDDAAAAAALDACCRCVESLGVQFYPNEDSFPAGALGVGAGAGRQLFWVFSWTVLLHLKGAAGMFEKKESAGCHREWAPPGRRAPSRADHSMRFAPGLQRTC